MSTPAILAQRIVRQWCAPIYRNKVVANVIKSDLPRLQQLIERIYEAAMPKVVDFTIPAGGLPYTLAHEFIDETAYIELMPRNPAATIPDLYITPVNGGSATIDQPEQQYRPSSVSVSANAQAVTLDGSVLPIDNINLNDNWNVDLVNNRLISQVIFNVDMDIVISGIGGSGENYTFTAQRFSSADVLLGSSELLTSTSNQNNTVSVSGGWLSEIAVGDYLQVIGESDSGFFDLSTFTMKARSDGIRGEVAGQAMDFRAIIAKHFAL